MNLLDEIEKNKRPSGFSDDLWALRLKWEDYDHGWTSEETRVCEQAMLSQPNVGWWREFLAGIDWTPDTPERLDKMIGMVFGEGLIDSEYRDYLKNSMPNFGRATQVCLGRNLAKWYRELKATKEKQLSVFDNQLSSRHQHAT